VPGNTVLVWEVGGAMVMMVGVSMEVFGSWQASAESRSTIRMEKLAFRAGETMWTVVYRASRWLRMKSKLPPRKVEPTMAPARVTRRSREESKPPITNAGRLEIITIVRQL
jgi:hypothetical protein